MPEKREFPSKLPKDDDLLRAERTAAILEASLAQIKEGLSSLQQVEGFTQDMHSQIRRLASLVERIKYNFRHLSDETVPRLTSQIQLLKENLETVRLSQLLEDLQEAEHIFQRLEQELPLFPLREGMATGGLVEQLGLQQPSFTSRKRREQLAFTQYISETPAVISAVSAQDVIARSLGGILENILRQLQNQSSVSQASIEELQRMTKDLLPFLSENASQELQSLNELLSELVTIEGDVPATMYREVGERLQKMIEEISSSRKELFSATVELPAGIVHSFLPQFTQLHTAVRQMQQEIQAFLKESRPSLIGAERATVERVMERISSQLTPPLRGIFREPLQEMQQALLTENVTLMQEALDKLNRQIEETSRSLQRHSLDQLIRQVPERARQLLGSSFWMRLRSAIDAGNRQEVEMLLRGARQHFRRYHALGQALLENVQKLSDVSLSEIPRLNRTINRTGRSLIASTSSFLQQASREAGSLGGLLSFGGGLLSIIGRFRGGNLWVLAASLAGEILKGLYREFQTEYMAGRRFLGTAMQLPGAGFTTALAETGGMENVSGVIRGWSLLFKQYMSHAFEDLRLPQQEYVNILNQLKTSGLAVEGVFRGIRIAGRLLQGDLRSALIAYDQLVRRLYSLSYATGLSYQALITGTRSIMRLTGSHNIDTALKTFIALHELGTRVGVSTEELVNWIVSATRELKWYGYALRTNARIITQHSQALYEGLVSVQDFTKAVRTFTGENRQVAGIGFLIALQRGDLLGRVLRQIEQEEGFAEAYQTYIYLMSNSIETIQRAVRSSNQLVSRFAQTLLERFGGVRSLGEAIREARLTAYGGVTQLVGGIGGVGSALSVQIFEQLTGLSTRNLARIGETLDMTYSALLRGGDSVRSALRPLQNIERLQSATEEILGASKSIAQHVEGIHRALRSAEMWLFGWQPTNFEGMVRPRSRGE